MSLTDDQKFKILLESFEKQDARFDNIEANIRDIKKAQEKYDQILANQEVKIDKLEQLIEKQDVKIDKLTAMVEKQNHILEFLSLRSVNQEAEIKTIKDVI